MAAPLKTQPTSADVEAFLAAVPDEHRRADARTLCALMTEVTGEPPVLWGPSIVGFGTYHYRYESGHEGDSAWIARADSRARGYCVLDPSTIAERWRAGER